MVSLTTDVAGRYQYALPQQNYTVRVTAPSHLQGEASVVVITGATTVQDFNLRMIGTDECAYAPYYFEGETRTGNNIGATGTAVTTCRVNDTTDVWWRYTPPSDGNATFTCTGDFDATFALFDGCGGSQLDCTDAWGAGVPETMTRYVEQGVTYLIRIAGYADATGDYALNIARDAAQRDDFPNSRAYVRIQWPGGASETVKFTGPSTLQTDYAGTSLGSAEDWDFNGRDQVGFGIYEMNLTGVSSLAGPVGFTVILNSGSYGTIEENVNNTSAVLDLFPLPQVVWLKVRCRVSSTCW